MKYQVLFSLKNINKYLCSSSAAVINGALRVNGTNVGKVRKCLHTISGG